MRKLLREQSERFRTRPKNLGFGQKKKISLPAVNRIKITKSQMIKKFPSEKKKLLHTNMIRKLDFKLFEFIFEFYSNLIIHLIIIRI